MKFRIGMLFSCLGPKKRKEIKLKLSQLKIKKDDNLIPRFWVHLIKFQGEMNFKFWCKYIQPVNLHSWCWWQQKRKEISFLPCWNLLDVPPKYSTGGKKGFFPLILVIISFALIHLPFTFCLNCLKFGRHFHLESAVMENLIENKQKMEWIGEDLSSGALKLINYFFW